MTKRKYIYWFLSVASLVLTSCTDDLDDKIKYLKAVVETTESGMTKITTYMYSGSQLFTIDDNTSLKEFVYTSGNITGIVTTNKTTNVKTTVSYTYDAGKLKTVKLLGDYLIKYTHNTDGTVFYEKFDISMSNVETKIHHGILYFKNGNIIKEERVLDNVAVGVISNYYVNYEYDYKTNPLHNVQGYEKLLDHEGIISSNNYLISTIETSVESNGQIISSATFFKNTFKYDSGNYPIEKSSLVSIPHKGISYNLKTVYNY